jgi:hypothetical protein
MIGTLPRRIADKILVDESGCWLWTGNCNRKGYGNSYRTGHGRVLAHRQVYELLLGTIPDGLELDHLCRTPACVNPEHLEPVTRAEHCARSTAATKIRCEHGHPLVPPNLIVRLKRDGSPYRNCRVCKADANRRYKQVADRTLRPKAQAARDRWLLEAEANLAREVSL